MPMQRHLYPPDWEDLAFLVKESANWICEQCRKPCRRPGEPFRGHQYTLTVAHLDHNPANRDTQNLKALCAPCHLRYDAPMKAAKRRAAKEAA